MATDSLPSNSFRLEHAEFNEHFSQLDDLVGALATASPREQAAHMKRLVAFLADHVEGHTEWEERVLYRVVDRQAGGREPFTASMRHEHAIIRRWSAELAAEAARELPDARAFARRADKLLGLLRAHMEEEEEVLLPVLDRHLTAEQFQREVIDGPRELPPSGPATAGPGRKP
jgi:hemerythrin-like domain-containing protein